MRGARRCLPQAFYLFCLKEAPWCVFSRYQMRITSYKMNVERYSRAWAIEANINKSQMTKACPMTLEQLNGK